MIYIINDILKTSAFISIAIILISLKDIRGKRRYTHRLNYIICILITLRMLFITNINIYLPYKVLKEQNSVKLMDINDIEFNLSTYIIIIFSLWLAGAICFLTWSICKQISFYKKIENITYKVNDKNILDILNEERRLLNIGRDIGICKVEGLSSPALMGIINNTIIMPNKEYDEYQLKWIFRHELIHLKRKDNFLKVLLMVACSIHWFNPLTLVLKKHFNELCELSCDERVIERSNINEVKEYALVLVNTLEFRNAFKSSISSQFNINQKKLIKVRIERMLSSSRLQNGNLMKIFLFALFIMSLITFHTNYEPTHQNITHNNKNIIVSQNPEVMSAELTEDIIISKIISRLTEEEKKEIRINRSEINDTKILVGDNKVFSIRRDN